MIEDHRPDGRETDDTEFDDRVRPLDAWSPSVPADEHRWNEQLASEVRPLIESFRRLRERGLLD